MDSDCELHSKRRRSNQREDQSAALRMGNLPNEIITDIISRLPFSSFVKFRYVCRAWRNLAQNQLQSLDHLQNSNTAENYSLCLIFHCDYPIRNHLSFVDYPFTQGENVTQIVKKIHTPFCAEMPEFDVVGSCDGLLCLVDSLYNDGIYIYNPFTRDYRELPKSMHFPNQDVIYGFGFHPISKEHKVVKIIIYKNARRVFRERFLLNPPQSEVHIFTLGSSNWRSIGKTCHYVLNSPQVLVNGRLHWVTWRRRYHPGRKLISFDLGDEQFREIPKPESEWLNKWNYHMLVVRGCLAAVFYCSFGKLEMWVMKEYGVKESWVKELTIGSHVPKALKQDVDRTWKISKIVKKARHVRVLSVLGSGQVLLEYKSRALVLYDPNTGNFEDLVVQGMPKWFQTVIHVGRLNRIRTLVNM